MISDEGREGRGGSERGGSSIRGVNEEVSTFIRRGGGGAAGSVREATRKKIALTISAFVVVNTPKKFLVNYDLVLVRVKEFFLRIVLL